MLAPLRSTSDDTHSDGVRWAATIRRGLRTACALLSLSTVSVGVGAAERPARARLLWTSIDPSCIDAPTLRARVEEVLERRAFTSEADADLVVEGRIERIEGGWQSRVVLRRATGDIIGVREFSSGEDACSSLGAGLPVAVALLIDMPLRDASLRMPAIQVAPAPVAQPMLPTKPMRGWQSTLTAGFQVRSGILPGIVMGPDTGSEWTAPGGFPIGLHIGSLVPRTVSNNAKAWALTASILGCPVHTGSGRFVVDGCARIESGMVTVLGTGFAIERERRLALLSALAEARVMGELGGSWVFGVAVAAGTPLIRHRFTYTQGTQGEQEAYVAPPVFGAVVAFFGLHVGK
jgi:hypothetical protein